MTPKKIMHKGGSRKRFAVPTTTKKPWHVGHTGHASGHKGGSRKTKSQREDGKRETMHEVCVACHREGRKEKVRIDDVRKETFKGKGNTLRARLVGKCEHGHKWYRITKA